MFVLVYGRRMNDNDVQRSTAFGAARKVLWPSARVNVRAVDALPGILTATHPYLKATLLQGNDLLRHCVTSLVHLSVRPLAELADALVAVVNHERPVRAVVPTTNHDGPAKKTITCSIPPVKRSRLVVCFCLRKGQPTAAARRRRGRKGQPRTLFRLVAGGLKNRLYTE
jgi:hypothetical protein